MNGRTKRRPRVGGVAARRAPAHASRAPSWAGLALAALLAGCAASGAEAIRGHAARGEVEALVQLYPELRRERERAALLRALKPHASEAGAGRVLLGAARPGASPRVRRVAIEGLARAEGAEVDAVLIEALGDPQPPVRAAAKKTILARGAEMAPALERASAVDPNPLIRAASLELLVTEAGARPELVETSRAIALRAADDPAPQVREVAVRSLGTLRLAEARPIIVEKLRADPSREVRMAAERALEKVGDAEAAPRATVAVLPLEVRGADPDGRLARLADRLVDVTRAKLSRAKVCEVIDGARMQDILRELRKRGELVYDGDSLNAPVIGKLKIANQLVYGSVHAEGPVFTVVLQRVDVSTMELVPGGAVTSSGYGSELDRLVDDVVERFARGFR